MFGGLGTIMGNTPEGKYYDAPMKEPSLVFLASEKSAWVLNCSCPIMAFAVDSFTVSALLPSQSGSFLSPLSG